MRFASCIVIAPPLRSLGTFRSTETAFRAGRFGMLIRCRAPTLDEYSYLTAPKLNECENRAFKSHRTALQPDPAEHRGTRDQDFRWQLCAGTRSKNGFCVLSVGRSDDNVAKQLRSQPENLLWRTNLEIQKGTLDFILVLGAGVGDFRFGLAELRLAEFNDGTASQFVTRLGQFVRIAGVIEELLG